MKIIRFLGRLLLVVAGGVVVLGAGGFFVGRALPQVSVENQCEAPIPIPAGLQLIPGVPPQIAVGGAATFPVLFGPGEYALREEGGGFYVDLPRSVPAVGQTILVSPAFAEPEALFEGRPVTIPMQHTFAMNETYAVVVCQV